MRMTWSVCKLWAVIVSNSVMVKVNLIGLDIVVQWLIFVVVHDRLDDCLASLASAWFVVDVVLAFFNNINSQHPKVFADIKKCDHFLLCCSAFQWQCKVYFWVPDVLFEMLAHRAMMCCYFVCLNGWALGEIP